MKNWNYIEGAKVGNAKTIVAQVGTWKIYYDEKEKEYYTDYKGSIYDNPGFKSKQEVIEYITKKQKTGNIKDDAKAKELHKKMMDAKEIAEEWGRASYSQKKDNLEGGRKAAEDAYRKAKKEYEDYAMNSKTGNDTPWEYAHRKPKVINEDKTGAEEFFKKLAHDVGEREKKDDADIEKVGNAKYDIAFKANLDGKNEQYYYVYDYEKDPGAYRPIKKFKTREEARAYKEKLKSKQTGNKKVGNASLETSVEKGRLGMWNWYIYKDGNIVAGGTTYTEAAAKEMARKALEKEKASNKKTGNAKDKNDRDLKVGDVVDVRGKKGKITKIIGDVIEVFYDNRGTYNPDRTDRHYADEATKVGNKNLDWNTGTIDWDVANFNGQWYITKNGQKLKGPFPSMKEAERYLDGHKWELQDKYGNAKTGNKKLKFTSKTDGKIEYVYDEESQDGFIYDDGKLVDTIKGAGQGWLNLIKQKAFSSGVLNKTGNSASDDKFAYVMREFDAGKLKTPDGKVVTDPAQAKAIAYSESKKTENGLNRARKAMNAWNSERKIEPVGKYREFIDNLKNAIELGTAGVLYNSLDEQTVKEWVEKAKKEGYSSHISGVQGKKVILK